MRIKDFFEPELLSVDVDTIQRQMKPYKKLLAKTKNKEQKISKAWFELAKLYFQLSIQSYVTSELDQSYHQAVQGFCYFDLLPNEMVREYEYQVLYFKYIVLFSSLKEPVSTLEQLPIYEVISSGKLSVSHINPPVSEFRFIETMNVLHANHVITSELAGYLALTVISGYRDRMPQLVRLMLAADALKWLAPTHPCREQLHAWYVRALTKIDYFPITLEGDFWFSGKGWAMILVQQLCDDWLLARAHNQELFVPSRKHRSAHLSDKQYNYDLSPHVTMTLSETDLAKFIGHFHPIKFSMASLSSNAAHVFDLALQKMNFLDARFLMSDKRPWVDLNNSKVQFQLLQEIKTVASKHSIQVDEILMKKKLASLYSDTKQRMGAFDFFKGRNFEGFDFLKAFFLLNKGLEEDRSFFPNDTQVERIIKLVKTKRQVANFVARSFGVQLKVSSILAGITATNSKDKFEALKKLCETLVEEVVENEARFLLQVQSLDRDESHAVYGVLEAKMDANSGTKGLHVVLSNGGLGSRNHQISKQAANPKHGEGMPQETVAFEWQNSDWQFSKSYHYISTEKFVRYKTIGITDVTDNIQKNLFIYYVMTCLAGPYLTDVKQTICTQAEYLEFLYAPNAHSVNSKEWLKRPSGVLEVGDSDRDMPVQAMGNCTVHNALYGIKYACNLSGFDMWYLTHIIEMGIDSFCHDLQKTPQSVNVGSLNGLQRISFVANSGNEFRQESVSNQKSDINEAPDLPDACRIG